MGQVNRVDSCRLAVSRAGERAAGSVAASDAFFPFEDGPQILLDAGVRAIVQPGGSVRDELTVEAVRAGRRDACTSPAPGTSRTDLPRRTTMTAQILDGTATLKTIKAELAERVGGAEGTRGRAGPRHGAGGRRPGLALVRRRQAQGLRRDRHHVDPPRPARHRHPGRGRGGHRRAERRPGLHRLHRPAADRARRVRAALAGATPTRTSTACTRPTSASWCSARPARCRARRSASSSCCVVTACRSPGPRWSSSAAGSPSAARSGCCSRGAARTPP